VAPEFRGAFGKLPLPKESERPPFPDLGADERQIERGGLTKIEIADLWDRLFLDIGRVKEFLDSFA